MKNLVKLAVVAVVIFAINACGGKTDTPEGVAEQWLKHFYKKEFAEAKKISTESTVSSLDAFDKNMGGTMEAKEVTIENMKCEVTGDNAVCTCTVDGNEDTIDLEKKDGKWLVNRKKEDMNPGTDPMMTDDDFFPSDTTELEEAIAE
jgi:hypothetical protein